MKKVVIVGPGGLGGAIAALLVRKGACQVRQLATNNLPIGFVFV